MRPVENARIFSVKVLLLNMDNTPTKIVTEDELRQMFADQDIIGQVDAGKLIPVVDKKHRHPSPKPSFEPFCTKSEIVKYRDAKTGEMMAYAHRYRRPNGTIGASGLPDPKFMLIDGIAYVVGQKPLPDPPKPPPPKKR